MEARSTLFTKPCVSESSSACISLLYAEVGYEGASAVEALGVRQVLIVAGVVHEAAPPLIVSHLLDFAEVQEEMPSASRQSCVRMFTLIGTACRLCAREREVTRAVCGSARGRLARGRDAGGFKVARLCALLLCSVKAQLAVAQARVTCTESALPCEKMPVS